MIERGLLADIRGVHELDRQGVVVCGQWHTLHRAKRVVNVPVGELLEANAGPGGLRVAPKCRGLLYLEVRTANLNAGESADASAVLIPEAECCVREQQILIAWAPLECGCQQGAVLAGLTASVSVALTTFTPHSFGQSALTSAWNSSTQIGMTVRLDTFSMTALP